MPLDKPSNLKNKILGMVSHTTGFIFQVKTTKVGPWLESLDRHMTYAELFIVSSELNIAIIKN